MKEIRIGIAMSGGVDSTACALLLRDSYQVEGFFMHLAQPNIAAQKLRVEHLAARLGIPLHSIDLQQSFKEKVLDYFSASYFQGLTPNPCVVCNREIKFGLFLDTMLQAGMSSMATGHYAQIKKMGDHFHLYKGFDARKDQSYFLSRLSQKQLARCLFPLGQWYKEQTYDFVRQHGFDDFQGLESQDVCFLDNKELHNYLDDLAPGENSEGPILSTQGQQLGRHNGLFHYTIGQRRGLGIAAAAPLYVVELDVGANAVIVGDRNDLEKDRIAVEHYHWLAGTPPPEDKSYTVRIRSTHPGSSARLHLVDETRGEIIFDEPQRAVSPGQFAVIYDGDELLGSAVIVRESRQA